MNVLGVTFDSKMNWQIQVSNAIAKAQKALYTLKLIRKFFSHKEMRTLLDSYFYSVLYYNASIWLTPTVSHDLKHNLMSISANALRNCLKFNSLDVSFENIHKICKKSTPNQITLYQLSLNLYKSLVFQDNVPTFEQITILDQNTSTRRQLMFELIKNNNVKIGLNTTANKLYPLNNVIGLDLINKNFVHFKKIMKIQFLKNEKT